MAKILDKNSHKKCLTNENEIDSYEFVFDKPIKAKNLAYKFWELWKSEMTVGLIEKLNKAVKTPKNLLHNI